jgi:hypothetical protein
MPGSKSAAYRGPASERMVLRCNMADAPYPLTNSSSLDGHYMETPVTMPGASPECGAASFYDWTMYLTRINPAV